MSAVFLSSNRSCWAWAGGWLIPLVVVPFTSFFSSVQHGVIWWYVGFPVWCGSLDPLPSPSASHLCWEANSPVHYTFNFDYTFEWRLWGQKNNQKGNSAINLQNNLHQTAYNNFKELCSLKIREILNKVVHFWKHISAEWVKPVTFFFLCYSKVVVST